MSYKYTTSFTKHQNTPGKVGKQSNLKATDYYEKANKNAKQEEKFYIKQSQKLLKLLNDESTNNEKEIQEIVLELEQNVKFQIELKSLFPNLKKISELSGFMKFFAIFAYLATATGQSINKTLKNGYINTELDNGNFMKLICGRNRKISDIFIEGVDGPTMTELKACLPNVVVTPINTTNNSPIKDQAVRGNNPVTREMIANNPNAYFSSSPNNIFSANFSISPNVTSGDDVEFLKEAIETYRMIQNELKKFINVPNSTEEVQVEIGVETDPNKDGSRNGDKILLQTDQKIERLRTRLHELQHWCLNKFHTHDDKEQKTIDASNDTNYDPNVTKYRIQTALYEGETREANSNSYVDIKSDTYGGNYAPNYWHGILIPNTREYLNGVIKFKNANIFKSDVREFFDKMGPLAEFFSPVELAQFEDIYGRNPDSPLNAREFLKAHPDMVLDQVDAFLPIITAASGLIGIIIAYCQRERIKMNCRKIANLCKKKQPGANPNDVEANPNDVGIRIESQERSEESIINNSHNISIADFNDQGIEMVQPERVIGLKEEVRSEKSIISFNSVSDIEIPKRNHRSNDPYKSGNVPINEDTQVLMNMESQGLTNKNPLLI